MTARVAKGGGSTNSRPQFVSKSKILSCRQCPKRLWLEVNQPALRAESADTEARMMAGHQVGEIARKLFDPRGNGTLVDAQRDGFEAAFAQSAELLGSSKPIFEAGFRTVDALSFADILLPARKDGARAWRMIEVKSSATVKDYHRDDVAIQAKVAQDAGVVLKSAELAHIDSSWTYPGDADYRGLFVTHDLTDEALSRAEEVADWITEAHRVLKRKSEPRVAMGGHCSAPFECGYVDYCAEQNERPKYPIGWIPRIQSKSLKAYIEEHQVTDMRDLPDDLLNEIQLRVKRHTLSGRTFFDKKGAAEDLAPYTLPAYFLDFETAQFVVPLWAGTRPYQQLPFQFSVHRLSRTGSLNHRGFLDLSGKDPCRDLAEALLDACGESGPIYAFNASFEISRIKELAERFPKIGRKLRALADRLVDLLKVARNRYYHPSQEGSWSIKRVLPAIAPDLDYGKLDGVQDGGAAVTAYLEAIHAKTSAIRRDQLRRQLDAYCELDTYGLVKVFEKLRWAA